MLPASRFLAIDTETSGFGHDARILEIGCVLFEGEEPVDTWSSLIRPVGIDWEEKHTKEALEVIKLTPSELEKAPTFPEVFHRLFTYLRAARVWVAHSANFDLRMLNGEFQRYKGSKIPVEPQEGVLCTLALSRALHPKIKGHKLPEVAARWRVPVETLHRAASDALTCGRILVQMSKGELPENVGWLHERPRQNEDNGSLWG